MFNMDMTGMIPKKSHLLTAIGWLCLLPALLFVYVNVMRYEIGIEPRVDPFSWFAADSLTRQILMSPVLLLGGSLLGVVLNLFAVLKLRGKKTDGEFCLTASIKPRLWNVVAGATGALVFMVLFGYAIVENIGHH